MELIPILSTIILAVTASTFLLAVGAYILYKIRERRMKKTVLHSPPKYDAELVLPGKKDQNSIPEELNRDYQEESKKAVERAYPVKDEIQAAQGKTAAKDMKETRIEKSKFLKYTSQGYISPNDDKKPGTIRWR